MKLFDTHAHIGLIHEDPIEQLIIGQEARQADVDHIISICNSLADFDYVYSNLETATHIYHSIGVSPSEVQNPGIDWEMKIIEGTKMDRVVAVGEIGLDYHLMTEPKEKQKEIFVRQLEIAKSVGKPVVIHTRDATHDTLEILKEYHEVKGIVHCYPGSYESALEVMDNYYFGVGGVVTFKNSKKLKEAVEKIPMEKIIIETDCPYLTPEPYRGKRNEPVYVEYVARKIAEIKGISYEEVVRISNENTKKAYGMVK